MRVQISSVARAREKATLSANAAPENVNDPSRTSVEAGVGETMEEEETVDTTNSTDAGAGEAKGEATMNTTNFANAAPENINDPSGAGKTKGEETMHTRNLTDADAGETKVEDAMDTTNSINGTAVVDQEMVDTMNMPEQTNQADQEMADTTKPLL